MPCTDEHGPVAPSNSEDTALEHLRKAEQELRLAVNAQNGKVGKPVSSASVFASRLLTIIHIANLFPDIMEDNNLQPALVYNFKYTPHNRSLQMSEVAVDGIGNCVKNRFGPKMSAALISDALGRLCIERGADPAAVGAWPDHKRRLFIEEHDNAQRIAND